MKKYIIGLITISALLLFGVACSKQPSQITSTGNTNVNQPLVGNDKDEHGCIGSAGYSWCELKQKCLRVWEEKCSEENSKTLKISRTNNVAFVLIDIDNDKVVSADASMKDWKGGADIYMDDGLPDNITCINGDDDFTKQLNGGNATSFQMFSHTYDQYNLYTDGGSLLSCYIEPVDEGIVFALQSSERKLYEVQITKVVRDDKSKEVSEIELSYKPLVNYSYKNSSDVINPKDTLISMYKEESLLKTVEQYKIWFNKYNMMNNEIREGLEKMTLADMMEVINEDNRNTDDIMSLDWKIDGGNANRAIVDIKWKDGERFGYFMLRDNDRWIIY